MLVFQVFIVKCYYNLFMLQIFASGNLGNQV